MLQGHTAAVTALYESREDGLLASGSEDSSVRLWDVRTTNRAVRRFSLKEDNCNCISQRQSGEWLVACGNSIWQYDIRADGRILIPEPTSSLLSSSDEINDLDCQNMNVVAGNDNGEIHYILPGFEGKRTRHKTSIVTSTKFVSENHVLSGGLDNELVVSNVKNGKVVFHANMEQTKTFNPPHIFAIDVLDNRACMAVGDGSICILEDVVASKDWKRIWSRKKRLDEVHLAATCCIQFLASTGRIISAGNDKTLAISSFSDEELELVHQFALPCKPNSIAYSTLVNNHVFVADTSNEIKIINLQV